MDSTLASVVIAALTFFGGIVAYFKLAKQHETRKAELKTSVDLKRLDNDLELENVKKENMKLIFDREMGLVNGAINTLRSDLKQHSDEFKNSLGILKSIETKYAGTREQAEKVFQALKEFIRKSDNEFEWMHSKFKEIDSNQTFNEERIVKLGDRVGLIMVREPKKTKG